jgi:hypothetical protein
LSKRGALLHRSQLFISQHMQHEISEDGNSSIDSAVTA